MEIIAHLKMEQGRIVNQSLKAHLLNVGAIMSKTAIPYGLGNTAKLIGVLHDAGKAGSDFQQYIRHSFNNPRNKSQRGKIIHSTAGAKILYELIHKEFKLSDVAELTFEIAAMAIFSHHSGLMNFLNERGENDFAKRLAKPEKKDNSTEDFIIKKNYFFQNVLNYQELLLLTKAAIQEILHLDNFINNNEYLSDEQNFFHIGMIEKYLFSLLVDADRLDTASFMSKLDLEQKNCEISKWQMFIDRLEKHLDSFECPQNTNAKRIFASRQKISTACRAFAQQKPGIYQLTVPTGSGKTLASLRFALHHAKKYNKKRIFYIIPYTSIIDQNAQVIKKIIADDSAVLEFHSGILEENKDDDQLAKLISERWDVPIILTTQVQLLNTLFSASNTAMRRLQSLADSIIIFDEIQTLPLKCTYLFNGAINFLVQNLGTTAIMCTATQPHLGRNNLDVPLMLKNPAEMVDSLAMQSDFNRVAFSKVDNEGGMFADDIARYILADTLNESSVLCIVNTTKSALNIYLELRKILAESDENIELIHLSTKLCPVHRKKLLSSINERLQAIKSGVNTKIIVISTQLIEAGVDVSFSVVYRALAGLSSIAQAAGRCNRNGETKLGKVKLFELAGENLDRLPDIKTGAKLTKDILARIEIDDILAPQTLDMYFNKFYTEGESDGRLEYKTESSTLFNILSYNDYACRNAEERGETVTTILTQGFGNAGRRFCVIDSYTTAVIVPYGEGINIIAELGCDFIAPSQLKKILRQAQQYMVNLFDYELQKLAKLGAIQENKQGILVLKENYYSDETGVLFTEQNNDFCMI